MYTCEQNSQTVEWKEADVKERGFQTWEENIFMQINDNFEKFISVTWQVNLKVGFHK